jgi:acyl-CoA synthetase (AMP-forming)/AMP-acid ligase II
MASGATYVPIPAKGSWQDSLHLIRGFDCNGLLYHFELDATVEKLRSGLDSLDFLIRIGSDSSPGDAFVELGGVAGEVPRPPAVDATAWLGATGGTTGAPKGVEVSWRAVYAFVQKFLVELPQTDPVMLAATPLTHGAGMLAIPIFAAGGRVVVTEGLAPDDYLSLIERCRVTMIFLPPTAIYRLLDHPGVDKRDYSSLRHFFYGAAAMSVSRLKQALRVFGPIMTQGYGQTECHTMITLMRPEDHFIDGVVAPDERLLACGRPTLGTIIEIRDADDHALPAGERGEICVSSDLNMTGYFRAPAETAATLVDGFVRTGDIGFIDADGFLHIVDRKKDMIISGGFNIYPAEVEQAFLSYPSVADCAVVGMPHEYWGEAVVAVIQSRPGETVDVEALQLAMRERLGPVKLPKAIHVWDELPKSAVGKVLKRSVRERLANECLDRSKAPQL